MLKIEFFGPSGSGKTYFKKKLINNYFTDYKVFDYRTINFNYNHKNFFLSLYFKIIKNKNIKKIKNIFYEEKINFPFLKIFYSTYLNKVEKSFLKKKDTKKIKFIESLINNSNFNKNKKKLFLNWSKEELLANEIAMKNKNNKQILIDSEGLIQRLFIYCYKKKNKKFIIKKYLSFINLPDLVVVFDKYYYKKNNFLKLEKSETNLIYNEVIKILKQKKVMILESNKGIKIAAEKLNNLMFRL